jgi:hypothetical protein
MSEKTIIAKECKYYEVEDEKGIEYITRSPLDIEQVVGLRSDYCGDELGQVISDKPLTEKEILDATYKEMELAKFCHEPQVQEQNQEGGFYRYKVECIEIP